MKKDFACGLLPYRCRPDGVREWLLIQHHAGHWSFPKGHPEQDETPLQTAIRETEEETGLMAGRDLTVKEAAGSFEEYYEMEKKGRRYAKTVRYWLAEVYADVKVIKQQAELLDWDWVSEAEVSDRLTFDAVRTMWCEVVRRCF